MLNVWERNLNVPVLRQANRDLILMIAMMVGDGNDESDDGGEGDNYGMEMVAVTTVIMLRWQW